MKSFSLLLTLVLSSQLFAGVCNITIDRTPCSAATKAEMLRPYKGINPKSDQYEFKKIEECIAKAEDDAKIKRTGLILKKVVTATFDGKDIGKNFTGDANTCEKQK